MQKSLQFFMILIFTSLSISAFTQERVVFLENFESQSKPAGWENELVIGDDGTPTGNIVNWRFETGGYFGYPAEAYQGSYNAIFQKQSTMGEITKLITPPIDLTDVLKPELRFGHIQQAWYVSGISNVDQLKVYYKRGIDSNWVLLKSYPDGIETWTEQVILLPDSSKSANYYLGFEGINNWGYGTCLDSIRIVETGVKAKQIEKIQVKQSDVQQIASGWQDVPILNIQLKTSGNEGTLTLDSLTVTSLNDNDNYIANNGVKLYATSDTIWRDPILVGSGRSFNNGESIFKNIGYDIPRGYSSVWVTYDIVASSDHDLHNAIADAKIKAEDICIKGAQYPLDEASPEGSAQLKESIFFDGLETAHQWTLEGFEVGVPQGLGPSYGPDPENAYSGTKVLGTDLSDDGCYDNNLTNRELKATTQTINASYYRNIHLVFSRWLNIEFNDSAYIDLSIDNKSNWSAIWENPKTTNITDKEWSLSQINMPTAEDQSEIAIRYAIGGTNAAANWTGWNIDNVTIIGDFISRDVGITGILLPEEGCGHTNADAVQVTLENFAGEATNDTIPLQFSFDDGTTWVKDTLFTSLPIGGDNTFTFSPTADLSVPGYYTITVTTKLPGDEIPENDAMQKSFYVYPTLTPDVTHKFESHDGYWFASGKNSSWAHGAPSGTNINSAYSGEQVWATNLSGTYSYEDSSFLTSPCYDFSAIEKAIFQFELFADLQEATDGMQLQYSTDEGTTWNIVQAQGTFPWNWYTSDAVSALSGPGWDTITTEWIQQRVLLPNDVANAPTVKFRFAFASNGSLNQEGVALDDIEIMTAPYNVGVSALTWPQTQCELSDTTHVNVKIKNTGYSTIPAGTKIPVGIDFKGTFYKADTLLLASDLTVNAEVFFKIDTIVDMSYAGDFEFAAYTTLENNPFFYAETCDDTLQTTISVTGMPNYDIGHIVGVEAPVNTTLDAGAGYTNYVWKEGESPTVLGTNQTLDVTNEGSYHVTVTNAAGCTASDTLLVVGSLENIAVSQILSTLEDSCIRKKNTAISIELTNEGLKDYVAGDTIPLAYQINKQEPVIDTLLLTDAFNRVAPNETAQFTFAQKADLKEANGYTIKVYSNIPKDLDKTNDTLTSIINTWGITTVSLAQDTIYSSQADTLSLNAGAGYQTYLWQDGSSSQIYAITENITKWYKVTVTDFHGCNEASDSTMVITSDLALMEIVNPITDCEHLSDESIRVRLKNKSGNTLLSGTEIKLGFQLDGNGLQADAIALPNDLSSGNTIDMDLTKTVDLTNIKTYELQVWLANNVDANRGNDTLTASITTKGYPDVNLAYDTIYTTQPDTLVLDAGAGFNSYSWNTGAVSQAMIPDKDSTYTYLVTVSMDDGCGTDNDSTTVVTDDLKVGSLVAPESACALTANEKIKIRIENNSPNTIYAGEEIGIGYRVNEGVWHEQTYNTGSDIAPNSGITIVFNDDVDMSDFTKYNFEVFARMKDDADRSNDTLKITRKTHGYPSISLAYDELRTTRPDTILLIATPGYTSYKWNEGTKNDTLQVSQNYSYNYVVTVSDANGCATKDSTQIYTYDLAVTAITNPVETCSYSSTEKIGIELTSLSDDVLEAGTSIPVLFRINNRNWVEESVMLSESLTKDTPLAYSFTQRADMSQNQLYTIEAQTAFAYEANMANDTLLQEIDALAPDINFGEPVTTNASSYTIDAGAGFTSYKWFDNSTAQTYTAQLNNQTHNMYYSVTVTNDLGCSWTDSLMVLFNFEADLGVTTIHSPASGCLTEEPVYMHITIMNFGSSTIPASMPIVVGYEHENMTAIEETFSLPAELPQNGTAEYTFSDPVALTNNTSYRFEAYTAYGNDILPDNDRSLKVVDIEDPYVNLGPDTLTVEEFPYYLDAGDFESYDWSTGDTTQVLETNGPGNYSVTVTDAQGCIATDKIHLKIDTGIENMLAESPIEIYPNPAKETLYIKFKSPRTTEYTLVLINMAGEQVYYKNLKRVSQDSYQIDVSGFAQGIYYLLIRTKKDYYHQKIVIE